MEDADGEPKRGVMPPRTQSRSVIPGQCQLYTYDRSLATIPIYTASSGRKAKCTDCSYEDRRSSRIGVLQEEKISPRWIILKHILGLCQFPRTPSRNLHISKSLLLKIMTIDRGIDEYTEDTTDDNEKIVTMKRAR